MHANMQYYCTVVQRSRGEYYRLSMPFYSSCAKDITCCKIGILPLIAISSSLPEGCDVITVRHNYACLFFSTIFYSVT